MNRKNHVSKTLRLITSDDEEECTWMHYSWLFIKPKTIVMLKTSQTRLSSLINVVNWSWRFTWSVGTTWCKFHADYLISLVLPKMISCHPWDYCPQEAKGMSRKQTKKKRCPKATGKFRTTPTNKQRRDWTHKAKTADAETTAYIRFEE